MAFGLRGLSQVTRTALDIVAVGIKGIDRAAMQAGFDVTANTGRFARGLGLIHLEISAQQCKSVRMPEPIVGMNHNAYR